MEDWVGPYLCHMTCKAVMHIECVLAFMAQWEYEYQCVITLVHLVFAAFCTTNGTEVQQECRLHNYVSTFMGWWGCEDCAIIVATWSKTRHLLKSLPTHREGITIIMYSQLAHQITTNKGSFGCCTVDRHVSQCYVHRYDSYIECGIIKLIPSGKIYVGG